MTQAFLGSTCNPELCGSELVVSPKFNRAFQRADFKTAVRTKWRSENAHINNLELEAALLAERHMCRSTRTRGHRVLLFIDSSSALGAIAKGRSSSSSLNSLCRRFCFALITGNLSVLHHWIPSECNLADKPSRHGQQKSRS